MGDENGFDDQFDDGLFRAARHTAVLARPRVWPKSVSEMRGHTSYAAEGMHEADHDTEYSDRALRRPYVRTSDPRWRLGPRGYQYDTAHRGWTWSP